MKVIDNIKPCKEEQFDLAFNGIKGCNIDWEGRRFEVAKAILPNILQRYTAFMDNGIDGINPAQVASENAIAVADEFIHHYRKSLFTEE